MLKITPIVTSRFRSDGGTMFGLVPKPIWARLIAPDETNAIPQNANCLLVELDDGRLGLVDAGCGDPAWFTDRDRRHKGLDGPWLLPEALAAVGIAPEAIAFVILTHLHWDHAGGVGRLREDGTTVLTFPHAQHFVHGIEWDVAFSGDPLLGQSYPPAALAPLRDALQDQVLLVTDAAPDVLPGVRMARTGGHTEGHCAVVLSDRRLVLHHPGAGAVNGPDTIVYAGDACPTHAHLRMVYQTAYDTRPLDTRAWKRRFLAEIADQQYLLMFCHDPVLFGATLQPDPNHPHEFAIDRTLPIP